MIRVLVVDDDVAVRESLRAIIDSEAGLSVVGEAGDGVRAVAAAMRLGVDVVVMDIEMPTRNGIEATSDLRRLDPAPHVLILTAFNIDTNTVDALAAGAAGVLLKSVQPGQLPDAIRRVADGHKVLDPAVAGAVINRALATTDTEETDVDDVSDLTPRERELLHAIGLGMSNNQIAAQLYLSPTSVKTYVSRLLTRVGMQNRTQLAILAYRSGLLDHDV